MKEIKMLNLFRCGSAEDTVEDTAEGIGDDCFATDYFDSIKIETLDLHTAILAECMGIKQQANVKIGVSHQRYCLCSREEDSEDIFQPFEEYPVLMVIQLFLNSDVYQAEGFDDGRTEKELSGDNWIHRLDECIRDEHEVSDKIKWKIYHLLTAGDFAVIVRSRKVHDAYDVVTLIRNIHVTGDENRIEEAAFYSYSICGSLGEMVPWEDCLESKDQVVLRIKYAQTFRKNHEDTVQIKDELLKKGMRLLGRYDHQISFTPGEFRQLYPFIRRYKFGNGKIEDSEVKRIDNEKIRMLVEMMQNRYISYINERLLLKYDKDDIFKGSGTKRWLLQCVLPWKSLYQINRERILRIKNKVAKLEKEIQPFYQSARNLKEYVRLAGRLGRVLYEMNKLHELRISTANVLIQYEIMIDSLQHYLELIKGNTSRGYAELIEDNLKHGIGALEIFTRYIRNVNLQTLQTPNYDLQTNVCIEKVLLAFCQFLRPYMEQSQDPYCLNETFYPIIVPSMSVTDLSVTALFNDAYEIEGSDIPKLMVIYSPTFSFLCETCFMIPAAFHEIGHHFRYEQRETRNRHLLEYILKKLLELIVIDVIDDSRKYSLYNAKFLEKIIDEIYKKIEMNLRLVMNMDARLQVFECSLNEVLQLFLEEAMNQESNARIQAMDYLEKTKGNIQVYDENILDILCRIEKCIEDAGKIEQMICGEMKFKKDKEDPEMRRLVLQMELKCLVEVLKNFQEAQIWACIMEELKKIEMNDEGDSDAVEKLEDEYAQIKKQMDEECKKKEDVFKNLEGSSGEVISYLDNRSPQRDGESIIKAWEKYLDACRKSGKDISDTRKKTTMHLLKQYHNVNAAYRVFLHKIENMDSDVCVRKRQAEALASQVRKQRVFEKMCKILYEMIPEELQNYVRNRKNGLDWNDIGISVEYFEFVSKQIRVQKEEGMQRRIARIFREYAGGRLKAFIHQKIDIYREATSDLFMCAMMNLDVFGYLVVASEILELGTESSPPQLSRISWVLQCITYEEKKKELSRKDIYEEEKKELSRKDFCGYLEGKMKEETEKLHDGIQEVLKKKYGEPGCRWMDKHDFCSLESIARFLEDVQNHMDYCQKEAFNSTQKWILRMFRQSISIVWKVKRFNAGEETIGDKEIWKDLSSEEAYYSRKNDLQKILRENGGEELCKDITAILNSPANFFVVKRNLLPDEISFILSKYEKSCRNIFETGREYGVQKI